MAQHNNILVGTASWTDKSLVQSGWYPPGVNSSEDRLKFYATRFPLVEVDSTYYFPPTRENAERWASRTPDAFTFNIKAFSLLTQHPTKPEALPKDLPRPPDRKTLYPKDLESEVVDEVWWRFLEALDPLVQAGKVGALLFQFPPWFHISRANRQYILECAARVAPLRICVEFRHSSWLRPDNESETLDFLTGHDLAYVAVDMPQGFPSSVPPVLKATSDLAVLRFHGHNQDEWESKSVQRRFAYLYSDRELQDWAPRIRRLAEDAEETHVLMNNCHRDFAQRNGEDLSRLLDSRPPPEDWPTGQ